MEEGEMTKQRKRKVTQAKIDRVIDLLYDLKDCDDYKAKVPAYERPAVDAAIEALNSAKFGWD